MSLTVGKRALPDSSFEAMGPTSPVSNTAPSLMDGATTSTPSPQSGYVSKLSPKDERAITRLMPEITIRLQPQIDAAIEKAVARLRDEIRAKDEIIGNLRNELDALKRVPKETDGPPATANSHRHCQVELESLEQYTRRNCLVVRKIPANALQGKSSDEFIIKLAQSIGVEISEKDICRSHQLGKIYEGHISLIVKFVSYNVRRKVIKARSRLKLLAGRITIQESLTSHRRQIFKPVDSLRYQKKIFSTWTDDGKILFKVYDGATTTRVPVEKFGNNEYSLVEGWILEQRDKQLKEKRESQQNVNGATGGPQ